MSHLEKLKQKMMSKPSLKKHEAVEVIIRDDSDTVDISYDRVDHDHDIINEKPLPDKQLTIIDDTSKPFDRDEVLNKLRQKKILKVKHKDALVEKEEIKQSPDQQTLINQLKPILKKSRKPKIIIEESDDEEDKIPKTASEVVEFIKDPDHDVKVPIKKTRITKKPPKGIAVIGPEMNIKIGDTSLADRIYNIKDPINIKVSSYYMNNREIFVNFINSLFEPYKQRILQNKEAISCDTIGKSSSDFKLLLHQEIVRDYMNLYTPYRGLLLYHGLGSGKTATSIAIAEAMKSTKKIIIMTPASLRSNYIEELKKAGDVYYKKKQFWEWIPVNKDNDLLRILSAILNLEQEYISKQKGAWFVNITKSSNYNDLTDIEKKSLEAQLNKMIDNKYTFINYNGLTTNKLSQLTSKYSKNLFDNSVVIIDEAHNLISRIVNKIKKEKPINEYDRGEKDHLPTNISTKLYEYLLSAQNARIVLLSGTPVINYVNEFAILFNILRGYIKTWYFPLVIKTTDKIDRNTLNEMLIGEKTHDYLDYSPSSKILTITRNPFGFKNKIKTGNKYQGVSNTKKSDKNKEIFESDNISDEDFERKIINMLKKNDISVSTSGIRIRYLKALPDKLDQFNSRFIDENTKELKNIDTLKRRIIGLSSHFRSAQESLLPKYGKLLGVDYHIVRIPMSNKQFQLYESARRQERKQEKPKTKKKPDDEEISSTYKIFSRLYCNFALPNRPMPKDVAMEQSITGLTQSAMKQFIIEQINKDVYEKKEQLLASAPNETEKEEIIQQMNNQINAYAEEIFKEMWKKHQSEQETRTTKKKKSKKEGVISISGHDDIAKIINVDEIDRQIEQINLTEALDKDTNVKISATDLLSEANKLANKKDMEVINEGEVEGDEILDDIGGDTYKERLADTMRFLKVNSNDYLTPEALQTYSPKFLHILDNIKDPEHKGLHLLYSQFRTLEGIGIFTLVLEKNGFAQFKIKKNNSGIWVIDIPEKDVGKPTFALYTGSETVEEKEIIRHIYNGEWKQIPESLSEPLQKIANNNNMGEVIKVFMITSSGSEGINLRNTRYVHIMEPYWHPVRSEQVIGRARRICSHKDLPKELQTVEVFVYLMIFTEEQLKSDEAIELKRKDLSKKTPKIPLTTDQSLFEISEIKANLTLQLTETIKQTSFDCYLYSGDKCVNFGSPSNNKFSYVPDYSEQQGDTIVRANKRKIEWVGKPVEINGIVYVYKRINAKLLNIYDKESYDAAVKNPDNEPVQIGTLEINEKGEQVFKQLIS